MFRSARWWSIVILMCLIELQICGIEFPSGIHSLINYFHLITKHNTDWIDENSGVYPKSIYQFYYT